MAGFLGSLKDKIGEGASAMSDRASSAKESIGHAADDVSDRLPDLPDGIKELKDTIVRQATQFKEEKMQMLRDFEQEKKNMLKGFVMRKAEALYQHGMAVGNVKAKAALKDPYMPMFVQDWVDELVDTFWPDITGEMKDVFLTGLAPKMIIDHGSEPGCCGKILGAMRYVMRPYDRTIWRIIRNPFWWLFMLTTLVPVYGIGMVAYILYFFIHDCGDEFQLESYIVDFKSLQFLNLGVVSSILGSVQYYICTSQAPSTCDRYAPKEEYWSMLIFVLQIFFVWAAFFMLGCAKKKGGYHYQYTAAANKRMQEAVKNGSSTLEAIATDDSFASTIAAEMQVQAEEETSQRSRRRLVKFLVYDMVIFTICIGLCIFFFFANFLDRDAEPDFNNADTFDSRINWKLAMSFFWVKAFYGMMSFPFIVLKMPILTTLVSHAKPTGYNPWGYTVPYLGEEEEPHLCPWKSGPHPTSSGPHPPPGAQMA